MNYNFFESLDAAESSGPIWSKAIPCMTEPALVEGWLLKASKKNPSTLEPGYFTLQSGYLLYRSRKESNSASSGIPLQFAIVSFPKADKIEGAGPDIPKVANAIQICLHGKFSVLYAESVNLLNLWAKHLSKYAMRVDFHERYAVNKLIGKGAFANVYNVNLKDSPDKQFAVKGFNKSNVASSEQQKLALWNEIKLLRRLDHPNVLRLVEVHETTNSIYLVTELYRGGELSKLTENVKNKSLPIETILEVVFGVGRALSVLADQKIAHRDLKPNNVILRKVTDVTAEDVVLVDVGMACDLRESNLIFKRCGTPGYIAPETISRTKNETHFQVSTKVDVFSLGCLTYALFTGKSPFEASGRTVDDIIKANTRGSFDFAESVLKQCPSGLLRLMQQMLSVDPATRPNIYQVLADPIFEDIRNREDPLEIALPSNYTNGLEEFEVCISPTAGSKLNYFVEGSTVDASGSNVGSSSTQKHGLPSSLGLAQAPSSQIRQPYKSLCKPSKFSQHRVSSSKDKTGSHLQVATRAASGVTDSDIEHENSHITLRIPLSKFSTLAKNMLNESNSRVLEQTGGIEFPTYINKYSA